MVDQSERSARLQEIAPPGGLCISGRAHDDVRDRLDASFADMGEQTLKNIARPVPVWSWSPDGMPAASASPPALALPDKPSIAVLPFQNMSGDREQEYLADGIVDDIITALTRMRWLFVIARNTSFTYKGRAIDVKQLGRELGVRYLLEGAVRKSANRVRITAQLIDAQTGAHLWAERYDRDLTDIFAVQDEMTDKVAGAIEPELLKTEGRAAISRTEHLSAWDLVRQGTWHFHQITREGVWRARELFREALKIDPQMPEANIWREAAKSPRSGILAMNRPSRSRSIVAQYQILYSRLFPFLCHAPAAKGTAERKFPGASLLGS